MKRSDKELSDIFSFVTELNEGTISPHRLLQLGKMLSVDPVTRSADLDRIENIRSIINQVRDIGHASAAGVIPDFRLG